MHSSERSWSWVPAVCWWPLFSRYGWHRKGVFSPVECNQGAAHLPQSDTQTLRWITALINMRVNQGVSWGISSPKYMLKCVMLIYSYLIFVCKSSTDNLIKYNFFMFKMCLLIWYHWLTGIYLIDCCKNMLAKRGRFYVFPHFITYFLYSCLHTNILVYKHRRFFFFFF